MLDSSSYLHLGVTVGRPDPCACTELGLIALLCFGAAKPITIYDVEDIPNFLPWLRGEKQTNKQTNQLAQPQTAVC